MSLGAFSGSVAAADEESDGDGTTLERTLLRGAPGAGGYAPVVVGAGEPYLLRRELGPTMGRNADERRVVASFAQLTDIHVMDVQSPARFEFLDPYASLPIPLLADLATLELCPSRQSALIADRATGG